MLAQHRRDLRRQAQAEPDRARRRRPHLQAARDRQARHRDRRSTSRRTRRRSPTARKLRDTFRQFELREPLRRLEEALGIADAAAPAPERRARARRRTSSGTPPWQTSRGLPHTELAVAIQPPETPEDALFAADSAWRFGAYADGAKDVLLGETPTPEALVEALGTRPVIAHDAKSLGEVPQNLAHDTEIGAYLLEPARRAYPFRELTEERGFTTDIGAEDQTRRRRAARRTRWRSGSARRSAPAA